MKILQAMLGAFALIVILNGCAILASKESLIACQVADAGTTIYAVNHGAQELNPIGAKNINMLLLLKAAFTWWAYNNHADIPQPVMAGVNVFTCGIAAHNVKVIRSQRP
jgi:hypothetical protein